MWQIRHILTRFSNCGGVSPIVVGLAGEARPSSCRRLKERGSYRPRGGARLLLCGRLGFSGGGLDGPACASGMMIWRFHYIVRRLAGLHSRGIGAIL